jgi:hypothetical protein
MTASSKAAMARALSVASLAYGQELERNRVAIYCECLADLDVEDVEDALRRLIAVSKWWPSVAEIREEVAMLAVADLPEPELAWAEVLRAVARDGAYRAPCFEHEEIAEAVRAIGWRDICLEANVTSTRARFIDAYTAVRRRAKRGAQLGVLAGGPSAKRVGGQVRLGQLKLGGGK